MADTKLNRLPFDRKVLSRFFSKIKISETHFYNGAPCWDWQNNRNNKGYGMFSYKSKKRLAHLTAYQMFVAIIPLGLECDHLCQRPICCNPAHIEPVTHRENMLRSDSASGINARKVYCKRGHVIPSRRKPSGQRQCDECITLLRRERGVPPRALKEFCKQGHPFTDENTDVRKDGARSCRICRRQRVRSAYRRLTPEQTAEYRQRSKKRSYAAVERLRNLPDDDPQKMAWREKNRLAQIEIRRCKKAAK